MTLVKTLVNKGANVNSVGKYRDTALTVARNPDVAEFLIKNGANVNWVNEDGKTPLMLATSYGWKNVVKLIKSHGGNPSLGGVPTPEVGNAIAGTLFKAYINDTLGKVDAATANAGGVGGVALREMNANARVSVNAEFEPKQRQQNTSSTSGNSTSTANQSDSGCFNNDDSNAPTTPGSHYYDPSISGSWEGPYEDGTAVYTFNKCILTKTYKNCKATYGYSVGAVREGGVMTGGIGMRVWFKSITPGCDVSAGFGGHIPYTRIAGSSFTFGEVPLKKKKR